MTHEQSDHLAQAIKAEARRLGFNLVGITSPEPPNHYATFESWLAAGRQGEMAYLATDHSRQRRADPRRILPGCQSILVLGIRYPAPPASNDLAGLDPSGAADHWIPGRIAAYAWSADYHLILPVRLQALVAFVEAQVGHAIANRWYTDTGPLLERDLAQRAGLGWIGKNTNLIHPEVGSYFLLAEILSELALPPDPPFAADRCGTCTRCIQACPTHCILPDRTLDARRCIAYLTIEHKAEIPLALREQIGNWIFGCDLCQQVCPWNRQAVSASLDRAFTAFPGVPHPNLLDEIGLSSQEFNRKFKGSPLQRAKRRGYLRNVAVALGNSGDRRAIPVLLQASQDDPEPLVREHAAWALARLEQRQLAGDIIRP